MAERPGDESAWRGRRGHRAAATRVVGAPASTAIRQWERQFLNYFDSRATNARSETRNLIIKQVKLWSSIGCTSATSPTSGPGRAGSTWRPFDLGSRRVVGWSMADHMRTELVADALKMAVAARRPAPGLIFHSDRGTQGTSAEFTDLLAEHEMVQSLSRPRQCWDNAVAESFFASLKEELIHRRSWATRGQARRAVVEYIEVFFNRRRLHSSLGYLSPAEYEAQRIHHRKAAQAA